MGTVGERVRALRKLLGWSQDKLGEQSGLSRLDVVKIETDRNKLSSFAKRKALATGFGLSDEDLSALVDGTISPEAAFAKLSPAASNAPAA